ncbi:MAG: WD40 repeat domain-containing protein, partial [Bacteroidota bacterium]
MQANSIDRFKVGRRPAQFAASILFALLCVSFKAVSFQDETPPIIVERESQTILSGHTNFVDGIAFSRDNKYLASAGEDSKIIIWDLSTGSEVRTLDAGGRPKSCVAFSPDGKTLAVGSRNDITLWDVSTWSLLFAFAEPLYVATSLLFTPDNNQIVSGDRSGKINVWNASDGKLTSSFKAFAYNVEGLALDTSGTIVVAGGMGDSLTAWNIKTGKKVYSVRAHHNGITGIAISPDGSTVATAGIYEYSEPRLWDVYTGGKKKTLEKVNSRGHVAFSKDGRFLFDGGEEGEID